MKNCELEFNGGNTKCKDGGLNFCLAGQNQGWTIQNHREFFKKLSPETLREIAKDNGYIPQQCRFHKVYALTAQEILDGIDKSNEGQNFN